jgi:membrane glycosyltransferase
MLFHTQFVAGALFGWTVSWKSPPREDTETTWGEALRRHGVHTLIGLAWLALVYWLNPSFLWWLLPVAGALTVSIPISVLSSRVSLGRSLREARIFLIPEESYPPRVLRRLRRLLRRTPRVPGFVDAVVDPLHNAIACAADVARTQHSDAIRHVNAEVVEQAIADSPQEMRADEKAALLGDALSLSRLHFAVWTDPHAHADWIAAREAAAQLRRNSADVAKDAA